MNIWNALKRPPATALKTIGFGALKGKSDIDPMWRVMAMTQQFGPCGIGWRFEIVDLWNEPAPNEQVFAFAKVNIYIRDGEKWSDPIPGVGGNMLVQLAKGSPKDNDEGYKMAITDALGTAMKMLGVAADIYMGKFDGSKYKDEPTETIQSKQELLPTSKNWAAAVQAYKRDGNMNKILEHVTISEVNAKRLIKEASDRDPGQEG